MMVAASASAQHEIVTVGTADLCVFFTSCPQERLEWWQRSESELDTDITVVAPAPHGRLFALGGEPAQLQVVELSRDGSRRPLHAPLAGFVAYDLIVGRDGAFFVLARQGAAMRILSFTAAGTLAGTWNVAATAGWSGNYTLALAGDQCTLFFAGENGRTIRRFDGCSGTPLADLATLTSGGIMDLHLLPDGGMLVATGDRTLVRLDAAGAQTRTYTVDIPAEYGGVSAFGLTDRGFTAIGVSGLFPLLVRIDLATGAVRAIGSTDINFPRSVTPLPMWTAAIGDSIHGSDIPALSTWAIVIVTAALALLALRRL